MRCPDCNRFVGVGQGEPEASLEVSDGSLAGDVRLVLVCAECGTELAESTQEVEIDITLTHTPECLAQTAGEDGEKPELEVVSESVSNNDRSEGKGRGGRHFYGADIEVEGMCARCKAVWKAVGAVEEQASYFVEC